MTNYCILKIQEHGELAEQAAEWFHSKWGIPKVAYLESINMCLEKKTAVPQWYAVMDGERIIAGCGVIENDFHDRKDLTPNVCAVYVEEDCRNQGIAGRLLQFIRQNSYGADARQQNEQAKHERCHFSHEQYTSWIPLP